MKSGLNYTDPVMRERLKRKILAGDKGGRPGEWSARKAQLLAAEYEKAGGGYKGGRTKAQRSLAKWTKQDWRTKSGKPSLETGERYLPAAAIAALSSAEYAATTRAKRSATGQFSRQPRRIARKTKEFRNPVSYPKEDITYAALSPTPANADIAAGKALLETPEFKKWFGDSKVRDLAKRPMVVYHGTCSSGFTKFDPTKTREMGFHFGTPPQAKDFLKGCGDARGKNPGIYPVYLSIQNPLFTPDIYSEDPVYFIEWVENTNHIHEWFPDENDSYYRSLNRLREQLVETRFLPGREGYEKRKPVYKAIWGLLRKVVTRKGYDGIRYKNENEGNTDDPYNMAWIAFSPAQIKSATDNVGTFNRRDPDIRNPLLYPPEQVRAYETEVQSRLGFPDQTQLGADLELQRHRQWNTDEFRNWFGESVVTKPNGAPLLVYHGTCKAGFTKFDPTKTREMGFHFGTWAQAKDFVGSCEKSEIPGVGPGVYPVYLSIQRALETPDLFSNIPTSFIRWIEKTDSKYKWFSGSNDPYFKKLKYLEDRGAMAIYKFSGKSASELGKFLKTNNKKLWNHLKAIIMRKGYDGIRYINLTEGNPGFADNIAWIAFSPAQVKSATDNRGTFNRRDAALDNPIPSMVRSKLSRIIEPGDRILCYDRAQGEDLYRLWDMIHTANPLTKEALVEIEGMLDDDGVLVIESGEEPPGLRDHFRKVIRYGGMLLVQGPMNPEEARINTEKLRREME